MATALDLGTGGASHASTCRPTRSTSPPPTSPRACPGHHALQPGAQRPGPGRPSVCRTGVRLELGSMLEPVAGQHFDTGRLQPAVRDHPAHPEGDGHRTLHLPGRRPARDRIVREKAASALPSVLAPGGTAHLLANWTPPTIRTPPRPRGPGGRRCGSAGYWARLIQRELQDPRQYAETWLQDASQQRDPRV
ncbi:hypothetical protein QJS66_18770 [Kocuria rhizophila]|nr:hypothetical protein QJS66_18770 [Kocuria rhizophila]